MPYGDDPTNSPADQLRFYLGDTDPADPLLTDNEVAFLLAEYGDVIRAAAEGAQRLAAKFAQQVTTTVGRVSEQCSQRAAQFQALADKLKEKADSEITASPFAGGISEDQKRTEEDDSDRVRPFFTTKTHDHPDVDLAQDPTTNERLDD